MKNVMTVLAFAISSLYLSSSWAIVCAPPGGVNSSFYVNVSNVGSVYLVQAQVGFYNAELLCNINGECTGYAFGSHLVGSDEAKLELSPKGEVSKVTVNEITFDCK